MYRQSSLEVLDLASRGSFHLLCQIHCSVEKRGNLIEVFFCKTSTKQHVCMCICTRSSMYVCILGFMHFVCLYACNDITNQRVVDIDMYYVC